MSSQNWFHLRGDEFMFDGRWWRKWNPKVGDIKPEGRQGCLQHGGTQWYDLGEHGGKVSVDDVAALDYRVPCDQPFQVGDRVKVTSLDGAACNESVSAFLNRDWVSRVDSVSSSGECLLRGVWFPAHCLEPAPVEQSQPEPIDKWRQIKLRVADEAMGLIGGGM